jgi:PKD repeat protein
MNSTYGRAPLAVQFTDQSVGNPISWYWEFGDGTSSALQNPVHVYNLSGVYSVTLTAYNGVNKGIGIWNNAITVTDGIVPLPTPTPAPFVINPAFNGTPVTGTAPLQVTFQDLSTGNPTYWLWKFGDGKYSLAQNATHWFLTPGKYTVSLQVQNKISSGTLSKAGYIVVL